MFFRDILYKFAAANSQTIDGKEQLELLNFVLIFNPLPKELQYSRFLVTILRALNSILLHLFVDCLFVRLFINLSYLDFNILGILLKILYRAKYFII